MKPNIVIVRSFPFWLRCFLMFNAGLMAAIAVRLAQTESPMMSLFCAVSCFNVLVAIFDHRPSRTSGRCKGKAVVTLTDRNQLGGRAPDWADGLPAD